MEMQHIGNTLLSNTLLRRGLLMLFGSLLSWLMLEVGLRVAFDALPPGVQGDLQSVRRVPWSDEALIPAQPFIIDRDFQVRMPVGLKNFPVRWSDAQFGYDTISAWDGHRAGLRSDAPQWPLDIMTFGDSFTWCWVAWTECWVKRLNSDSGWKVFNAAIPGTGPSGQLALMKELTPAMKPRLVVWLWFANDMSDDYDLAKIRGEVGDLSKGPYPDPVPAPSGLASISAVWKLVEARLNPPPKLSPYQHYQEVFVNGRAMSIHTEEYAHPYALSYGDTAFGIERNLQAHASAVQFLRTEANASLLIVLLPVKEEAYADLLAGKLSRAYLDPIGEGRRRLLAQCQAQGWHCLDALPPLQAAINQGQTIFYGFDSHLDVSGNRVLAQIIADYIRAKGLLPTP
jgi:SGNH hydrolase-like domain, acetyltransferase AlgX